MDQSNCCVLGTSVFLSVCMPPKLLKSLYVIFTLYKVLDTCIYAK